MPTRNINLTDRLDRFIETEVGSGRYGNASEVVREGLRLMERRKQEERAKLKWLRGAVSEGLDQIERGEGLEFRSMDELERQIDRLGKEVSARPGRRKQPA
jgi:antitoxin ParD1/3/4